MEADTLSLDSGKGILSAGRLALLPQYDKYQYAVRVGDHTDWVMLDVREIACSGVSLPYLSGHDMLHADSVSVGSVEIDSYKDRNQLQSPAFRQMLYTSVQRIPVGIDFPVIDARGINIRYEEVSKGATVPGVVTFTDMDARITGLTNRPQKPTQQYRIYAEVHVRRSARQNHPLSPRRQQQRPLLAQGGGRTHVGHHRLAGHRTHRQRSHRIGRPPFGERGALRKLRQGAVGRGHAL